ncbi:MAG: hypothetical protein HQL34_13005 [Alphaproteobacteria bacterium]|nr:hypothetical protein [Alphaproteobacteria bacterium]
MDYESLGRYTEASERARSLAAQRHNKLVDLSRLVSAVTGHSSTGYVAVAMDCERMRSLLEEAAKLDAEMLEAVAVANAVAASCGKPLLKIWQSSGS